MLNEWGGCRHRRRSRCWWKPTSCVSRASTSSSSPDHVKRAAHAAIDGNFTKYTPAAGTSELKQAICARYKADYGVEYKPSEVIVTAGGKQALYNVAVALFGRGDEVITHAPCWPTLLEQVKLADASPVVVQTYADDGFAITAQTILNAPSSSTRPVIRPAR